ncbi:nucleotidyltransferase domain-containing protein [Chloroflexi bacterium CFX6]|nr:nucleotidyltransferase domain-containing protein [Chloroflexi bacterium CFX6]
MPKEIRSLLDKLKSGLKQMYGKQFREAYLFGSYARGDYDPDSDIDVLIVLSDFEKYGAELNRTSELIGDLSLEYGITVSVVFTRQSEWQSDKLPFLLNIHAEGVAL